MTLALHVGASGMGKTHALARVCEAYADKGWTVVVVDAKREWSHKSKRGALVSGPRGADKAAKRADKIVVWQGADGYGNMPDVDAACAWALERGRGTLVAVPEAHLHWPLHKPPENASVEVLTGYRHRGLAVLLDTQRLVSLSTMARNNLDICRVFGVVGPRDLYELTEWGGPALAVAARECARRRRAGERGWYIPFDPACPGGPYRLERFT